VSHGLLLLRSGKTNTDGRRIDILFSDVTWMALPVWFEGLEINLAQVDALPLKLPSNIQKEVALRTIYRLTTDGIDHFIVAGEGVYVAEDDANYMENSSLIPDLQIKNTFPE